MHFYCEKCKKEYPLNSISYHCSCGGLFRLYKNNTDPITPEVSIGEIETPLIPIKFGKQEFFFKMENLNPTGSFKARGAKTMISILKNLGIKHIIEDSSGNAASAIAAYAAAANMKCTAYVPENIAEGKLKQIETFGAQIRLVIGNRDTAAKTAQKEATKSKTYYASHVYNPLFFEGIKSLAYEIYHQLNDHVPEYIFLPVGNGTMLLGLYYGFEEIGRLPKFIAVQSENCCPLYNAFKKKRKGSKVGYTIADSIRVEKPMRLKVCARARAATSPSRSIPLNCSPRSTPSTEAAARSWPIVKLSESSKYVLLADCRRQGLRACPFRHGSR